LIVQKKPVPAQLAQQYSPIAVQSAHVIPPSPVPPVVPPVVPLLPLPLVAVPLLLVVPLLVLLVPPVVDVPLLVVVPLLLMLPVVPPEVVVPLVPLEPLLVPLPPSSIVLPSAAEPVPLLLAVPDDDAASAPPSSPKVGSVVTTFDSHIAVAGLHVLPAVQVMPVQLTERKMSSSPTRSVGTCACAVCSTTIVLPRWALTVTRAS
jgi:hypothetical protein